MDPRMREIVAQVTALMEEAGLSGLQLSARAGVDQSHLSKWLRGEAGFSTEGLLNVLGALNAGLGVQHGDVGDVRTLPLAGNIDSFGLVTLFGGAPTMPAIFTIDGDRGPFKRGDRVLLEPGEWTPGKWAMVRHADGAHRLHRCEERNGLRLLAGTELIVYDETTHEIVGLVEARVERM